MSAVTRIKYTDTALPLASGTYTLFSTVDMAGGAYLRTAMASGHMALAGIKWCNYAIANDENGTIRLSYSTDGGTTWHVVSDTALTDGSAAANVGSLFVEGYADFKVEWVNGGTNQTQFDPALSLSDERSANA